MFSWFSLQIAFLKTLMICAVPTFWGAEGMCRNVFDMFLEKAEGGKNVKGRIKESQEYV